MRIPVDTDHFKQAWQTHTSQTRLTIDAETLLKEVQRNQQNFATMIFWRDIREIGVALLLIPLWLYLGKKSSLPWTWYLTVPVLLWYAGFMLAARMRGKRRSPEPTEPLRQCVESSLADVENQIWLLSLVLWWALLPMAVAMLAFFVQVAWRDRGGGWWIVLGLVVVSFIGLMVLAVFYWMNQYTIRCGLEPRRQELEVLRRSLVDEPQGAG
jgi:hypothetical protein